MGAMVKDVKQEDCARGCGLRYIKKTVFTQGPHGREKRIGNWSDRCRS